MSDIKYQTVKTELSWDVSRGAGGQERVWACTETPTGRECSWLRLGGRFLLLNVVYFQISYNKHSLLS